jgi:hypothetical protein
VLEGAVEHGRTGAVGYFAGALGQLQRDDLAALARAADHLQLEELRILARQLVHVGAHAVRPVVVPPDVEPVRKLGRGRLASGLPLGVAEERNADALDA